MFQLIGIAVPVVLIFIVLALILSRYRKCPTDKILVIFGSIGGNRSAKCIHGGAAFVWPFLQDYAYLSLSPMPIQVSLQNALSRQNIRVNVPSNFVVGITTEPGKMELAAERLMGLQPKAIIELAQEIIIGQLRQVVATMNIEDINANRDKFMESISVCVEKELDKVGLRLINVNITDITDDSGYLEQLGKEAAAKALNDAKKVVAEKNRDGLIGEAEADRDRDIQVANAKTAGEIGKAEADKKRRIETSTITADAIDGENKAKIQIANSNAERSSAESFADGKIEAARSVADAQAKAEIFEAEKIAEEKRGLKNKATQEADTIVQSYIERQKVEIDALAQANKSREIAKGEADAIFAKMEADAKGKQKILEGQAEGLKKIIESCGGDAEHAVQMLMVDKIIELTKIRTEAIKNVNFDKITVWDNASGGKTSDFLTNVLGLTNLPPLQSLLNSVGIQTPEFLGKPLEQGTVADYCDKETPSSENQAQEALDESGVANEPK